MAQQPIGFFWGNPYGQQQNSAPWPNASTGSTGSSGTNYGLGQNQFSPFNQNFFAFGQNQGYSGLPNYGGFDFSNLFTPQQSNFQVPQNVTGQSNQGIWAGPQQTPQQTPQPTPQPQQQIKQQPDTSWAQQEIQRAERLTGPSISNKWGTTFNRQEYLRWAKELAQWQAEHPGERWKGWYPTAISYA